MSRSVALAAGALALGACAHAQIPLERPLSRSEIGLASFYSPSLHGQLTASGAPYDQRAMTCAHRWLPFGAVVRVTDLETRRSVKVEVTDRGPHLPGRIVDLSLAAAEALGIIERGLVRVEVVRVQ